MPSDFEILSDRILKHHHAFVPSNARYFLGLHEYDGLMPDYSQAGIENRLVSGRQDLADLDKLDLASLNPQERFDVGVLRHNIEDTIFNLAEKKDWEKIPLFYQGELDLLSYTTRDYAPLPERIAAVNRQQLQIPAFIEAARANLKPPFRPPGDGN